MLSATTDQERDQAKQDQSHLKGYVLVYIKELHRKCKVMTLYYLHKGITIAKKHRRIWPNLIRLLDIFDLWVPLIIIAEHEYDY